MIHENKRLPLSFYSRGDVLIIARELLGKRIVTDINGIITSGVITESEAYNGVNDKASHAFGDRRTKRTETMYRQGGIAYIYLCYGIHSLFNVVTNVAGTPHAVLIRAIMPEFGKEAMADRIGRPITDKEGTGPGKVTKLLALKFTDDKADLINGNKVWIENTKIEIPDEIIKVTKRIGVDYAGDDALLPYRFLIEPEKYGLLRGLIEDCFQSKT